MGRARGGPRRPCSPRSSAGPTSPAWSSPSAARTCAPRRRDLVQGGRQDPPRRIPAAHGPARSRGERSACVPMRWRSWAPCHRSAPSSQITRCIVRRRGRRPAGTSSRTRPRSRPVLAFTLDQLRESFAMRRLVRRGVPIRTPTYLVGEHLIWGATRAHPGRADSRSPTGEVPAPVIPLCSRTPAIGTRQPGRTPPTGFRHRSQSSSP